MIITLGILSLLQVILVPGLILIKAFNIRGFWENFLAAIGLSQLFNYLFVIMATLLHIYTQTTSLVLFGVEVVLLFVLYYPKLNWKIEKYFSLERVDTFFKNFTSGIPTTSEWARKFITFLYYFIFFIAVGLIIKNFFLYVANPTQIFTEWDAVVSWNKWATEWFQGSFPTNTWHYPQLLTTNSSIPYQFTGTKTVTYFSKYFANIIEFFIIFIVFILGIKKKDIGYFLGVIITSWLMFAFGSRGNGYADSPVAFWALLSISCLILSENNKDQNKLILLGAFFVSAAALTKQAGLWLIPIYPILIVLQKGNKANKNTALILQTIVIMALLVAPWYIYKEIQIQTGLESSEIAHVTGLVLIKNDFFLIFSSAHNLFMEVIKNPYFSKQFTFILLILLMFFSFKDKLWRNISSLITIPFWIGWIFLFSYEKRNLVLIIPLLSVTIGIGLRNLIHFDWNKIGLFFRQKTPLLIIVFIKKMFKWAIRFVTNIRVWYFLIILPVFFFLPYQVPDSRLLKNSLIKQRSIGDIPVNELIYDYKANYGLDGKILTSYAYLGYLPELEPYFVYIASIDYQEFLQNFNDPNVGYALLNDHWWSGDIHDYLFSLIDEKKIDLIATVETPTNNGTFYFVTTCHGVCK